MGCPVNSIRAMEDGLRYRRQKMVIVILASANSDSRAVNFVLRNFHEMDLLSDDVDFYLPGYGINKYNRHLSRDYKPIEWMLEEAERNFPDFHDAHTGIERRTACGEASGGWYLAGYPDLCTWKYYPDSLYSAVYQKDSAVDEEG